MNLKPHNFDTNRNLIWIIWNNKKKKNTIEKIGSKNLGMDKLNERREKE